MLDLGEAKNINKSSIAEREVQEFEEAIQHQDFHNQTINNLNLAIATACINNKTRYSGLSSREVFTHRHQSSYRQIPLEDKQLIFEKHASALKNHQYSVHKRSKGNQIRQAPDIRVGDLVHL